VLDLNPKTRRRSEQNVNTYFRLFKDELQPQINADFAKQEGKVNQVAHRNRFLSENLKSASPEVRQLVEENRRKAEDRDPTKTITFLDGDDLTNEELERRRFALKRSE
jgi:hypothetical protein